MKPRSTYVLSIEGGHATERQAVHDRIVGLLADASEMWRDHPRIDVLVDEISEQELRDGKGVRR